MSKDKTLLLNFPLKLISTKTSDRLTSAVIKRYDPIFRGAWKRKWKSYLSLSSQWHIHSFTGVDLRKVFLGVGGGGRWWWGESVMPTMGPG